MEWFGNKNPHLTQSRRDVVCKRTPKLRIILTSKMEEDKLIYDFVVGYMLKVIKSGIAITKYKNEFNAVKHGDYVCFIELLNVGYPNDITVSKDGEIIASERQIEMKNADFLFLLLASTALKEFYKKCYAEFGEINDADLSDTDFENLANFEMVLRMFANNQFVIENRITLVEVINLVCHDLSIPDHEINLIQKGREFLNMVKGHKANFSSYTEGLIAFSKSLEVLKKYEIVVIA